MVADGKQNKRIWRKTSGDDSDDDDVKLQKEARKNMRLSKIKCYEVIKKVVSVSLSWFCCKFSNLLNTVYYGKISVEMSQKKISKRNTTSRRFRKSGTKKAVAIEPYTYPSSSNSDSSGKFNSVVFFYCKVKEHWTLCFCHLSLLSVSRNFIPDLSDDSSDVRKNGKAYKPSHRKHMLHSHFRRRKQVWMNLKFYNGFSSNHWQCN